MTGRSAHASLKGYFYQFDHSILQLLQLRSPNSSVVVEGIEDVDLEESDSNTFVQCKYHEASRYQHSLLRPAVVAMFEHFSNLGFPENSDSRYKIYGHYNGGQDKLSAGLDTETLKQSFLTYKRKGVKREVHLECSASDSDIQCFLDVLDIDLLAPSYEEQLCSVFAQLAEKLPDCRGDDAQLFYYPVALSIVRSLAIRADHAERRISKREFFSSMRRKDILCDAWLRERMGEEKYAKVIYRKYFKYQSTKVPKSCRVFVIDVSCDFEISKIALLLSRIAVRFSHLEHSKTPAGDRFCPYVFLNGLSEPELVELKGVLHQQGMNFSDGYPYKGSGFSLELMLRDPTKENMIRLKILHTVEQVLEISSTTVGVPIEVFDFYTSEPVTSRVEATAALLAQVKVKSPYFIEKVIST